MYQADKLDVVQSFHEVVRTRAEFGRRPEVQVEGIVVVALGSYIEVGVIEYVCDDFWLSIGVGRPADTRARLKAVAPLVKELRA